MGTTTDKLNHLINIKEGIRQEINWIYYNKEGVVNDGIDESATFNSYIQKLEENPFYEKAFIEGSLYGIKVSNITKLDMYAFKEFINLKEVSFPNVVEIEGSDNRFANNTGAFNGCGNLREVSFPIVQTIGGRAFQNCYLSEAKFPLCQYIGYRAFGNCRNLRAIYVGTSTSTVCTLKNTNAFNGCDSLTSIYVPSSLVNSYKSATNWSEYASIIKAAP